MPLFWIIVLILGGSAVVYTYAKAPPTGLQPGATWPSGVNASQALRAVGIALSRETDPKKLRAFANSLERYDRTQAQRLIVRAHQIELTQLGILTPLNPTQRERLVR